MSAIRITLAMQQLIQYKIDITLQEIEDSDGYLEYHKGGYPIYYAYNIIPDNGELEEEYFEAVYIVKGSSELGKVIDNCPCCGEKPEVRISGQYFDIDKRKDNVSELIKKYCLEGDSVEFKILLEKIGTGLGII